MGLSMLLFYVVVYGSSVGSILWVLLWCILVRLGLRYRLLWFWVLAELFLGFYLWVLGGLKVEV